MTKRDLPRRGQPEPRGEPEPRRRVPPLRQDQRVARRIEPLLTRTSHRCTACGDRLLSTSRDDDLTCTCGAVSIRGGRVYFALPPEEPADGKEP